MTRAYKVATEGDEEGRSMRTLGYATGDVEDIKALYSDRKMYQSISTK